MRRRGGRFQGVRDQLAVFEKGGSRVLAVRCFGRDGEDAASGVGGEEVEGEDSDEEVDQLDASDDSM